MEGQVTDMEQEVIITNNNLLLHFNDHNDNICKPEEGWYGQPKYCYKKQYTLF